MAHLALVVLTISASAATAQTARPIPPPDINRIALPADSLAGPLVGESIMGEPIQPWADFNHAGSHGPPPAYHLGAIARGYLQTDSRVAWSGQETTFGAEGVLLGNLEQIVGDWQVGVQGEFFLNQPFERNLLVDTPVRQSFRGNFQVDPFEISQLHVAARRGDLYLAVGKFVTPFGRFYFPQLLNSRADGPFIRTEAIEWRETGVLAQLEPAPWSFTIALTNGGEDRDTNVSKALITRVGLQNERYAIGFSGKLQDGIGSGNQKTYDNHVGVDALVREGPIHLSAEVVYDEYGFRRPFDPLDITWGRSLYGRDLNNGSAPICGVGYYLNLGCQGAYWNLTVNYGEFYPRTLGNAWHDEPNRRGIVKCIYHWSRNLDLFVETMVENEVADIQPGAPQGGFFGLFGAQFIL